jgi:hypothetical protein
VAARADPAISASNACSSNTLWPNRITRLLD